MKGIFRSTEGIFKGANLKDEKKCVECRSHSHFFFFPQLEEIYRVISFFTKNTEFYKSNFEKYSQMVAWEFLQVSKFNQYQQIGSRNFGKKNFFLNMAKSSPFSKSWRLLPMKKDFRKANMKNNFGSIIWRMRRIFG